MLPLVVNLHNTKANTREVFAFETSPVRIGRNKLNELSLSESVVSQWHGLLRFGEGFVVFLDLGSTNGSILDNQKLPRNTEVPLGPDSVLRIAHLEFRFARAPIPASALTRKSSSFLAQVTGEHSLAGARTVMFQAGALTAPRASDANPQVLAEVLAGTRGVYTNYTNALEELTRYVEHYVQHVQDDQKGPIVMSLREKLPHFARTREFRRVALKAGLLPDQIGDVDVEAWIKQLVFGTDDIPAARGAIDTHRALTRIGAILEAFAQSFVELRNGHDQFLQDVGLRLNTDLNGLENLRSARAVLAHLLDWSAPDQSRVDELNRAFTDIAMHQVGLVNGVVEGARGMLSSLAPEVVAGFPPAPRNPAVRDGASSVAGLFGGKLKAWWKRYATRQTELEDGDRFARELFGRAFASAYFTIMGNARR